MERLKFLLAETVSEHAVSLKKHLSLSFDIEMQVVEEEEPFYAALSRFKPDLIFSNYFFRGFDALKLLAYRNEHFPTIPFILVGDAINDELVLSAIKEGVTDCVDINDTKRFAFVVKKAFAVEELRAENKKKYENSLQVNYNQFIDFVENDISGDYLEEDDKVIYCNKKLLELFEFETIEQLNEYKPIHLYNIPSQRDEVYSILKEGKKVVNKELSMHTLNGKQLTILENAHAELDEKGTIKRVQGYLIDITEQKEAEEKLIESEALFRTLMGSTTAGVVIYNKENFLFTNSAITRILGYSIDELKKMNFWDLVHPDHKELVKNRGRKRIDGINQESNYQFKVLTKTGEIKWLDATANKLIYKKNPASIATLYDITQLKKAENEIKELSVIIDQSPLAIAITNTKAEVEYVNKAFIEVTGYSRKELLGQNPRVLSAGVTPRAVYDDLWKTLRSGKVWKGEFVNKNKSGANYIELAIIFPVFDEKGKIVKYAAIKRNITKEKEIQQLLKEEKEKVDEANRLKTAILTNMSHELRTPLNGILGFSTLIHDLESVDEIKEMVNYIHESGKRLLRTLNLIIDVSRLEAGNFKPFYETVDLVMTVNTIIQKYQSEAELKNISLNFESDFENLPIESDLKFINDAIENLIDNSIKFTQKGSVTVRILNEKHNGEKFHVISVADTGIGISEKNQKLIFEDFQQESVGYGRVYEGTGLGLSIGRKYIQLLGGFIDLKSKIGEGSVFSIYLPEKKIN